MLASGNKEFFALYIFWDFKVSYWYSLNSFSQIDTSEWGLEKT